MSPATPEPSPLAGPIPLAQGGKGVVGRLPVFLENADGGKAFWGFTMVLIRVPDLLRLAQLPQLSAQGYRYELWRKHPVTGIRETIEMTASGPPVDPVSKTVNLPGATWTLLVSPAAGWGNPLRRWNLIGAGVLLSLLFAYLAKLAMELRVHKLGLESQVAQRTAEVRAREADLNRAQSVASLGSWVSADDGRMQGSAEACRIFRVPEGTVLSDDEFLERVHVEDRQAVRIARNKALRGEPCQVEFRLAGEPVRWVQGTSDVTQDDEAGNRRIVSTVQDITERKHREADLRVAAVAFETHEGMMITDARQVILRVNKAITTMTGYSVEEAVGRTPNLFKSDRHDADFFAEVWQSIDRTGAWQGELWNRRKNGEVFPCWMSITAVTNDSGEVTNYVGSLSDITQRKAAEAEIERLAFYDALTGLPNRRLLGDRLSRALVSATRKRRSGAILFIDLDDFKTLNDTQGHEQGDVLLRQVAERLSGCVREGDTVARLGGDEYVIMLEDLLEDRGDAANQTETIGEMVLARLGVPYSLSSGAYHQSASIGIMLFGGRSASGGLGDPVDELLKGADLAMYRAKEAGGNTLRFFDPEMQGAVMARAELVNDLREGLRENQFRLDYQAQVDREGRLLGAEALVRWHSPTRGLVSPAEFIPVAEQTGLIVPLGHWVMETACAQLARWAREAGHRRVRHGRQRECPRISQRRLRREDAGRSGTHGRRPEEAHDRIHRKRAARRPGGRGIANDGAQGTRRGFFPGRLRHGLLVARLREEPAGEPAEDRQVVRARRAHGSERRDDRACHHRACEEPGARGGRRGRGIAGAVELPDPPWLPRLPGLSHRQARQRGFAAARARRPPVRPANPIQAFSTRSPPPAWAARKATSTRSASVAASSPSRQSAWPKLAVTVVATMPGEAAAKATRMRSVIPAARSGGVCVSMSMKRLAPTRQAWSVLRVSLHTTRAKHLRTSSARSSPKCPAIPSRPSIEASARQSGPP